MTVNVKRFIALLLALIMAAGCGCAAGTPFGEGKTAEGLSIVCTIFPEYDWVRQIMGELADTAELTMLLDNGVDIHSYQPTADDIIKISTCDLFIYVGGESDGWVEGAIPETSDKDTAVIDLMELLGDSVREEEAVEGMEPGGEEKDGEEPEYDEHVWLSLKNAETACGAIAERLEELDPANAGAYAANAAAYTAELETLYGEYKAAVEAGRVKTLLFGDRFPFRYLTDDCGLNYYAAFAGCSAETEASFETIVFLADKVNELGLKVILTIEGSDHRIAETIRGNTASGDQKILSMDSMQSVTSGNVAGGETYISIMRENLEVLRQALS